MMARRGWARSLRGGVERDAPGAPFAQGGIRELPGKLFQREDERGVDTPVQDSLCLRLLFLTIFVSECLSASASLPHFLCLCFCISVSAIPPYPFSFFCLCRFLKIFYLSGVL